MGLRVREWFGRRLGELHREVESGACALRLSHSLSGGVALFLLICVSMSPSFGCDS